MRKTGRRPRCCCSRRRASQLPAAWRGREAVSRDGLNWFNAYFSGGLDALLGDVARSGRPSEIKSEEIAGASAKGLKEGSWGVSGQVREWLREEYGIERSDSTVRCWLGKLGGAHKVPRPVYAKKDEAR